MYFYGVTEESDKKDLSRFSFSLKFRQHLKRDFINALLKSGNYNEMLYWIKAQDRMATAIAVC